ncbi:uncharacterized protein [Panulirus ornatus]|uniref:uncharacterized protein n=1 Tax=Panulirus ornatus TaxID=150431 RepID=UPI003A851AA2
MFSYIKLFLASFLIATLQSATAQYILNSQSGNSPINTISDTSQTGRIIFDNNHLDTFNTIGTSFANQNTDGTDHLLHSHDNFGSFAFAGSRPVTDFALGQDKTNAASSGITFGQASAGGLNLQGSNAQFGQAPIRGLNIQNSIATFGQAPLAGVNLGGSDVTFPQPAVGGVNLGGSIIGTIQSGIGSFGVGDPGFSFGQAGAITGSGFNAGGTFGPGQGPTRIIEAPATPTVTNTVTIDRFVTATDLAFHSVPVTLTDLVLRTTTVTSRQPIITPVDDRIALQTSVVIRPTSLTVTCTKHDYIIKTEVAVDYVTITHTSYIIRQTTYTTTVTQASTYAATMVRTIIHTQRTTVTDYHTVTNAVYGQAGVY